MPPIPQPLPISPRFSSAEEYVTSLLQFSSDPLFQTLCGGVHILDFFTREKPYDLYTTVLPKEWREYFSQHDIDDILDLLMRKDLEALDCQLEDGKTLCPKSLKNFIKEVRDHCLRREFTPNYDGGSSKNRGGLRMQKKRGEDLDGVEDRLRHLTVGMKPKKLHEVENFSLFLNQLLSSTSSPISSVSRPRDPITHIVDFGSGQGYLPRILASPKYGYDVVALESKQSNIDGALDIDRLADKREAKRIAREADKAITTSQDETQNEIVREGGSVQYVLKWIDGGDLGEVVREINPCTKSQSPIEIDEIKERRAPITQSCDSTYGCSMDAGGMCPDRFTNGRNIEPPSNGESNGYRREDLVGFAETNKRLLIVSLHSCGNLVHHALKSIVETREVKAVAVIGCCYNLMTEKFGATYKPPFRDLHPRLISTSTACDPLGFPLSNRLEKHNITLNITARMMACQAPLNWTKETSSGFFTRHFYRALLQKIFVDRGIVAPPKPLRRDEIGEESTTVNMDPSNCATQPIILGSLRKKCYTSFPAYVAGALSKLDFDKEASVRKCIVSTEEAEEYERIYMETRKKELSIMWSLMAFCAGVVESLIVVDRWMWLKEQEDVVASAWVQAVFGYEHSPRNLVVVGIKKSGL